MAEPTPNRGYLKPARGSADWHLPLNENFGLLDEDVQSLFDIAPRFGYIVSKRDGLWRAVSRDGADVAVDENVTPVLQYAGGRGNTLVASSIIESNGDLIDSTVTVPSALVDCANGRVEGSADPIFDFGANARGLHNARVGGRLPGGGKPDITLVRFDESGQRAFPFLLNVTLGFSFGWGAVIGGVQQTYMAHVQVDRLGDVNGGGGGLLFTDNNGTGQHPAGHLGSNSFTAIDIQAHGSATGGPIIASRTLHGGGQALNGMKLRGLDIENGNQSGVGGGSAHIDLQNAQRLEWSHIYMRGLRPVDYAINYDFSNGDNVLHDARIKWDPDVTAGASIRKFRGGRLTITDSSIHEAGGGPDAIVGEMTESSLEIANNTRVAGRVNLASNGTGRVSIENSSTGGLRCLHTPMTIVDSPVGALSSGNDQFKHIIRRGGGDLPELNPLVQTNTSGVALVDWESSGILFDRQPVVRTDARGPVLDYVRPEDFHSATYNGVTYWTGVTVHTDADLSGTPAPDVPVEVAVAAAP